MESRLSGLDYVYVQKRRDSDAGGGGSLGHGSSSRLPDCRTLPPMLQRNGN